MTESTQLGSSAAWFRGQAAATQLLIDSLSPTELEDTEGVTMLHRQVQQWTQLADELDTYLAVADEEHPPLF